MDTIRFILVCAAVFLALLLASRLFEAKFCKNRPRLSSAKYLCTVSMCAALAAIAMLFEFPLPFLAPHFYQIDLSELPLMICGFYLGPTAGVLGELIKILLNLLIDGTETAYVGEFANFAVGCSLVVPAAMVYHVKKNRRSAILGLCVGTTILAAFGSFFNAVYLLPAFSQLYALPLESIVAMGGAINGGIRSITTLVLFAVFPLNLIKGALVSVLTLLLYKKTERLLFKRT